MLTIGGAKINGNNRSANKQAPQKSPLIISSKA
jgi:hypothetical protein